MQLLLLTVVLALFREATDSIGVRLELGTVKIESSISFHVVTLC